MLQHIIITPFSYRRIDYQPEKMPDPLNPRILKKRFQFFEMLTLPSLKGQENKNFTWVIVIDPELPEVYRRKFLTVTAGMQNVFLHNFIQEKQINSLDWLKPYIHAETDYLINTLLDADDGIYMGFTKYLHGYFKNLMESKTIQPLHFVTCKNVYQWDFICKAKAPLGFIKPWIRENTPTVSAGLTVCSKYPEIDMSILDVGHRFVGFLFTNNPPQNPDSSIFSGVAEFRNTLKQVAMKSGLAWNGEVTGHKHFHQIATEEPHALIVNNLLNDRFVRAFEGLGKRKNFYPHTSVPGVEIDFDLAARLITNNRKTFLLLIRILWMFLFEKNHVNISNKKSKFRRVGRLIRGFREI